MAYNQTAKGISALGRKGDDTLLHVSKEELAGLQSLLGPISVNPETGLPEAWVWKDLVKTALIGLAGAYTGGAAGALAPEFSGLIGTAVGSGQGALLGGALSASEGKGFNSGALGGAISGGLGGYGGATLPGEGATTLAKPVPSIESTSAIGNIEPTSLARTYIPNESVTGYEGLTPSSLDQTSIPYADAHGMYSSVPSFKPQTEFNLGNISKSPGTSINSAVTSNMQVTPSGVENGVPSDTSSNFGSLLGQQSSRMGSNKGLSGLLYPVGAGTALGTAATDMIQQGKAERELAKQQQALADANDLDQRQYFASLGYDLPPLASLNNPNNAAQRDYIQNIINPRGAAAGGSMAVQLPIGGTQVSAILPPKYVGVMEKVDIPSEQNEIKNELGLATGGYINNQPVDPNAFYPQSQIHSAQPYAAATPQRHEVIDYYKDGGFLDGPGDGMSDDIAANIDGEEEIRLADGEFVVPPDLVRMLGYGDPEKGAELLDNLLPIVRQASHGKKTQIKQDAGRLAAEKMLARAAKGKKA